MKSRIKYYLSIGLTYIFYICGGKDNLLEALLLALVFDYFTGVSKAFINNELSSDRGLKGIVKKVVTISLVVVANIVDLLLGSTTHLVRNITIYALCCNECLSVIENLSAMNIFVPKYLKNKLLQVVKTIEEKEEVNNESNNHL